MHRLPGIHPGLRNTRWSGCRHIVFGISSWIFPWARVSLLRVGAMYSLIPSCAARPSTEALTTNAVREAKSIQRMFQGLLRAPVKPGGGTETGAHATNTAQQRRTMSATGVRLFRNPVTWRANGGVEPKLRAQ